MSVSLGGLSNLTFVPFARQPPEENRRIYARPLLASMRERRA